MTDEIIRCSVPNCNSTAYSSVNFYTFPDDEIIRNKWITIIGRPDLFELPVEDLLKNYFICSLHLGSEDQKVNFTKNTSDVSENNNSNGSFQRCLQPTSSTSQDVDEPAEDKVLYCTCGLFFFNPDDFKKHIKTDCLLISNRDEASYTAELDNDESVQQFTKPIKMMKWIPKHEIFLNDHMSHHNGHRSFRGHLKTNHSDDEVCKSEDSLNGHLMYEANNGCNISPQNFDIEGDDDDISKLHSCRICGKKLSSAIRLRNHMSQHSGYRPFQCHLCGMSFVEKSCLKSHMRTIHSDEKHICVICNKVLGNQYYLKTHLLNHKGIKNYKCNICQKEFVDKYSLKTHSRSHSKEKPFKCTLCTSRFSQATHLKTHMRIHTGEKPFKCTLCTKSFRQVANLNEHKKTHL